MLGRLLPRQIKLDDTTTGVKTNFTVVVTGVPSGTMFTPLTVKCFG